MKKYIVCVSNRMTRIRCVTSASEKQSVKTLSLLFSYLVGRVCARGHCFSFKISMRSKKHCLGRKLVFRGRKFNKHTIVCSACRLYLSSISSSWVFQFATC